MNYRKREVLETSNDLHVLSKRGGNVFTVRMGDLKEGLEEGGDSCKSCRGRRSGWGSGHAHRRTAEVGDQGLVRTILKNFVIFLEQLFPTWSEIWETCYWESNFMMQLRQKSKDRRGCSRFKLARGRIEDKKTGDRWKGNGGSKERNKGSWKERKWLSKHEMWELKILEEVLADSCNVQYCTNCVIQLIELKSLLASSKVM